jgi:hypothetical protein
MFGFDERAAKDDEGGGCDSRLGVGGFGGRLWPHKKGGSQHPADQLQHHDHKAGTHHDHASG